MERNTTQNRLNCADSDTHSTRALSRKRRVHFINQCTFLRGYRQQFLVRYAHLFLTEFAGIHEYIKNISTEAQSFWLKEFCEGLMAWQVAYSLLRKIQFRISVRALYFITGPISQQVVLI
jgi:hypothetical protein